MVFKARLQSKALDWTLYCRVVSIIVFGLFSDLHSYRCAPVVTRRRRKVASASSLRFSHHRALFSRQSTTAAGRVTGPPRQIVYKDQAETQKFPDVTFCNCPNCRPASRSPLAFRPKSAGRHMPSGWATSPGWCSTVRQDIEVDTVVRVATEPNNEREGQPPCRNLNFNASVAPLARGLEPSAVAACVARGMVRFIQGPVSFSLQNGDEIGITMNSLTPRSNRKEAIERVGSPNRIATGCCDCRKRTRRSRRR